MSDQDKLREKLSTHAGRMEHWTGVAKEVLLNKKIVDVVYDPQPYNGRHGLIIVLEDGTHLYPMRDDEGNGVGSVHTNNKKNKILPVL